MFSLVVATVAALVIPAISNAASKTVAKEGTVESLGETVLTNNGGHTLYSLSVEKNGKFVCISSCLSTWHPLTVSAGTHPKGPVGLGTVKRPDGRTQVTFKGRPLYAFSGDTKSGQAGGEGLRDVGIWHAAALAKTSAPEMPSPPTQESPPYPYPYPYPQG